MEPMSAISKQIFRHNFDFLVANFRCYWLHKDAAGKKYGEGERGTFAFLLAINAQCLAKQGARTSTYVTNPLGKY
jgi:hypothetical protein